MTLDVLQVVVQRATADVYAACIDSKLCIKVRRSTLDVQIT